MLGVSVALRISRRFRIPFAQISCAGPDKLRWPMRWGAMRGDRPDRRGRLRGVRVAAAMATALLFLPGFRSASGSVKAGLSSTLVSTDGGDYDVLDYDDEVDVDRTRMRVKGRERIRLQSLEPALGMVVFPRNGIGVMSVRADCGGVLGRHDGEVIQVLFPRPLGRNQIATIEVAYRAERPKGVEFHRDAVYTSFNTCSWMICREDPADKATLRLSIGGVADLLARLPATRELMPWKCADSECTPYRRSSRRR
jgi:hypothetical protein